MRSRRVLVVGAGWEQERLLCLAKRRGYWVLATAWPAAYSDALSLADVGEMMDPRDLPNLWELAQRYSVEAVVADQCDYSYFAAAYIADRLGLPGATLAAAQVATNKYHQRERLVGHGVPQPCYRHCDTLSEVWEGLKEIGYPAILKPIDNRGNFGVTRVDSPQQVPEAYYEAISNAHSRKILVEEFIEGTMTTVEGFMFPEGTHLSLVSSSKVMLGGRKRVAMELRYPAELPAMVVQRLLDTNQKAMNALGYGVGPTHAEYMVTADGQPYYIEAANRGGGVLINSHIVPALTGVDTTNLMVDYATGNPIVPVAECGLRGRAVLSFFGFPQQGEVTAIYGLEEARALPGVVIVRILIREGSIINPITTDANRHGFVIAQASNLQGALGIVNRVKELVQVVCRRVPQ